MKLIEHLLVCLAEEGGEVAKEVSKALRFGLDDRNILNPEGPTNRERIISELNDFKAVVEMLVERGVIRPDWESAQAKEDKKVKVGRFCHYAREVGALVD